MSGETRLALWDRRAKAGMSRAERRCTGSLNHYISWQSTSTLLVTPLVTTTGPGARQTAVPPSYCGLRPETVYVPTSAGTENRPFAPTVMPVMCPLDPWRVTCPLRARGPSPGGPPTAWSVPVRVPVGPAGPVGDEQLANNTEAAMTGSRESKLRDFRRTAYPPSGIVGLLVRTNRSAKQRAMGVTLCGNSSLFHAVSTCCRLLGPLCVQAARRWTSQTVAAMSSTDNASSPPPSIHWTHQKWLVGW